MSRTRPIQNPSFQPIKPAWGQALAREKKLAEKEKELSLLKLSDEVERTLNPKTGRARYNGVNGTYNCIQMVDMLPWWRRLLVPFVGEYCEIEGVKYLKAGETNILYRAQEWIEGRRGKDFLEIVGSSKIPVIDELDLPKVFSNGTACEVE